MYRFSFEDKSRGKREKVQGSAFRGSRFPSSSRVGVTTPDRHG